VPPLSRFDIDLAVIPHNLARIREAVGKDVGLCAVLKADAYGLGSVRIASQLSRCGVDMVAVYTPGQAQVVLRARVTCPVLVLAPVRDADGLEGLEGALAAGVVQLAVHDPEHVRQLEALAAGLGAPLHVHVEADTGMARGGIAGEEALDVIKLVHHSTNLRLSGLYTHLASAGEDDDYTAEQADAFDRLLDTARSFLPDDCIIHEANTFGVLRGRRHHRRMIRVGLLWAGYGPEEYDGEPAVSVVGLRPILRWTSTVVHLKSIPAGTRVGYGGIWRAERPARLALVAVGYADGYPLNLGQATGGPKRGEVGFRLPNGKMAYAPVVGRVSMDQLTVDVTDLPEGALRTGDVVELVGRDPHAPNHLPVLARRAGSITHDLLCRFGPPINRIYIGGGAGAATADEIEARRRGL
jgi:alanine racemase